MTFHFQQNGMQQPTRLSSFSGGAFNAVSGHVNADVSTHQDSGTETSRYQPLRMRDTVPSEEDDKVEDDRQDDSDTDDDSEFDDDDDESQQDFQETGGDDELYDVPEDCRVTSTGPPVVSRTTKPQSVVAGALPKPTAAHVVDTPAEECVDGGIVAKLQFMLRNETFRTTALKRGSHVSADEQQDCVDESLYEVPEDAREAPQSAPLSAEPALPLLQMPAVMPKRSVKAPPPATRPKPAVARKPNVPKPGVPFSKPGVIVPTQAGHHTKHHVSLERVPVPEIPPDSVDAEDMYLIACDGDENNGYEVSSNDGETSPDAAAAKSNVDATVSSPLSTEARANHAKSLQPLIPRNRGEEMIAQQFRSSNSLPTKIKTRPCHPSNKSSVGSSPLNRPRNVSDPGADLYQVADGEQTLALRSSDSKSRTPTLAPSDEGIYQVADEEEMPAEQPLYEVDDDSRERRVPPVGKAQARRSPPVGMPSPVRQGDRPPPALPSRVKKTSNPSRKQQGANNVVTKKEKKEPSVIPDTAPKLPSRVHRLAEAQAEASDEDYVHPDGQEQDAGLQTSALFLPHQVSHQRRPRPPPLPASARTSEAPEPPVSEDDENYLELQEDLPRPECPPRLQEKPKIDGVVKDTPRPIPSGNKQSRTPPRLHEKPKIDGVVKDTPRPIPSGNKQSRTREQTTGAGKERYSDCEPMLDLEALQAGTTFDYPLSPAKQDNELLLRTSAWFFGKVAREVAETKLNAVSTDGCFLVRAASDRPGYSLSLWYDKSIRHLRIPFTAKTKKYNLGTSNIMFDSVVSLVDYFTEHAIGLKMGGSCHLKTPCPK